MMGEKMAKQFPGSGKTREKKGAGPRVQKVGRGRGKLLHQKSPRKKGEARELYRPKKTKSQQCPRKPPSPWPEVAERGRVNIKKEEKKRFSYCGPSRRGEKRKGLWGVGQNTNGLSMDGR